MKYLIKKNVHVAWLPQEQIFLCKKNLQLKRRKKNQWRWLKWPTLKIRVYTQKLIGQRVSA